MAHQFKPVDRDAEMLLPHNMLDWVPEGHAVRVVIGTVERLATRDLAGRLVPPAPAGSAAGPARYDPVMLLAVWMYAYLRGVLSTRAVEDRCRYDATFRVACGRLIPDHTTFSRFRQHLFKSILEPDGSISDRTRAAVRHRQCRSPTPRRKTRQNRSRPGSAGVAAGWPTSAAHPKGPTATGPPDSWPVVRLEPRRKRRRAPADHPELRHRRS